MIPLLGKMQAENACMAALAIKLTHPEIDEKIIEKGLSHAVLPGRFEVMHNVHSFENVKTMILDGAHTVHSIALTLETMEKIFSGKKINLLFACAADKDISEIAPLLKNKFFHVFITKPGIIKECNLKAVMEAFNKAGIDYICEDDFSKFIPKVMKQTSKDDAILLVTGSFYLVSEVKKTLGIWN